MSHVGQWNYDNQSTSITGPDSVTENYSYDADNARVKRVRGGSGSGSGTTIYMASGLWEESVGSGASSKSYYQFNGQTIAMRDSIAGVTYLHGDHLGSVSLATNASGSLVSQQEFDPWGKVRTGTGLGSVSQTTINYTGQRLDGTGLLYYNARYYDPAIARFVSADSIVPGAASGAGGAGDTLGYNKTLKPELSSGRVPYVSDSNNEEHQSSCSASLTNCSKNQSSTGVASIGWEEDVALKALTTDFHEAQFAVTLNEENDYTSQKGFWFQLSDKDRQKAKNQWGPANPQALNRYSYVLNNPLRYIDPTGHVTVEKVYIGPYEVGVKLVFTADETKALYIALGSGDAALTLLATKFPELAPFIGIIAALAKQALAIAVDLGLHLVIYIIWFPQWIVVPSFEI